MHGVRHESAKKWGRRWECKCAKLPSCLNYQTLSSTSSGSPYAASVLSSGVVSSSTPRLPSQIFIDILQLAMGWTDSHLHRFLIHGKEYGIAYDGGMGFDDDPK